MLPEESPVIISRNPENMLGLTFFPTLLRPDVIYKTNTSGVRGVYYSNKRNKWIAQIMFKQKCYYLGGYDCIEEAAEARHIAEEKLFGDFLKWYDTTYKKSNTNNRKKKEVGISLKR